VLYPPRPLRMLSRPAQVHWAGFESDTYRLQQAGWELAVEEEIEYDRIRLMMRHRDMRLYALTDAADYYYRRDETPGREPPLRFNVCMAAPSIQVQRMNVAGPMAFENFRQIDAKPQMIESEIKSIEDFRIFATPLVRTEEIIVAPQTVSEMLQKILEMQLPEQERIRQRERLAESREAYLVGSGPRQRFHAQILSIDDYRAAA
jgi:hypothetical protein